MDRLVYTALSGMRRAAYAQALTANNLANAATVGFQRDTGTFQSRWVEAGIDSRVQATEQITSTEVAPGAVGATGRGLDVALKGDALLAVAGPGGGEAYTRRGDLKISETGALTTGDGRAVIGAGGPVTLPPAQEVQIAADGQILFRAPGDQTGTLQVADTLKMVRFDAAAMRKGPDGMLRRVDGGTTPADPALTLQTGALEASNATPVQSLVQLIETSRAFSLQTKLVGLARELDAAGTALMRAE